jgi:3-isopropylmalate/(R)-2-methylmalate dehydratase large subunit
MKPAGRKNMAEPLTAFDKIWDAHVITKDGEDLDLIHIDRSLLTDLSGTVGLEENVAEGRPLPCPELHVAIPDHAIATDDAPVFPEREARFAGELARLSELTGMRHWPRTSGRQGIVHVAGIEQGLTLPGATLVCGDSHTSTHGAVGAIAWGIGTTEVRHVLATQTLWLKKPLRARIWLDGTLGFGVTAKDIVLALIGQLGTDYGREHAIEFAGPVVRAMSIEARATLCNLAIEMGARIGFVAPDETTFAYLKGRPFAPKGKNWDAALAAWALLQTDDGAVFDKEERIDISLIAPQLTWGTSPNQVVPIGAPVPSDAAQTSLDYIGLSAGDRVAGIPIDYVFIGSCANSRIEDLRAAAEVLRGKRIADHVTAWVVPGSEAVADEARAEGLDTIFIDAGFDWRLPGCSMCNAVNGDTVPSGKRVVSTSNRNFVGRQGPGSRTHLASPITAAACALAGSLADPRDYLPSSLEGAH